MITSCKDQLASLTNQLKSELDDHVRVDVKIVKELELKLHKASTSKKSLESKLEDAQDELIYAKRENEKLSVRLKTNADELQRVKDEINAVKLEFEQFRKNTQSVHGELEIYRKQGKELNGGNARRVAIGLAQHCLELSAELEKYRQKEIPAVEAKPKSGWDDDDSLFD